MTTTTGGDDDDDRDDRDGDDGSDDDDTVTAARAGASSASFRTAADGNPLPPNDAPEHPKPVEESYRKVKEPSKLDENVIHKMVEEFNEEWEGPIATLNDPKAKKRTQRFIDGIRGVRAWKARGGSE